MVVVGNKVLHILRVRQLYSVLGERLPTIGIVSNARPSRSPTLVELPIHVGSHIVGTQRCYHAGSRKRGELKTS